jgi:hypothetical protein
MTDLDPLGHVCASCPVVKHLTPFDFEIQPYVILGPGTRIPCPDAVRFIQVQKGHEILHNAWDSGTQDLHL